MKKTKKLILCRHSDAELNNSENDFERKLTKEGVEHAIETAHWLKENNINPDKIICSPSIRTIHTTAIFNDLLNFDESKIKYEPKIYDNNFVEINRIILKEKEETDTLMIIGHNPSMSQLAGSYSEIHRFPTAGCVIMDFDVEFWNYIDAIFLKDKKCNFDSNF